MRSALGRPTRRLFFERLRDVAPQFVRTRKGQLPGFTWPVEWNAGPLGRWLWLQQHKNEDAFTVEVSWSLKVDDPVQATLGDPGDPFSPQGCRFRLGAFWEPGGDHWWHVSEPPPSLLDVSFEEYLAALQRPLSGPDLTDEMPRIAAAVDDAVSRIRRHALPYFDRVSSWATTVDRD